MKEKQIKQLVKKFGYNELENTCKEQGWRIPLKKEIENEKIDYRYVWVCDKIKEDDYPEEFYAYQMNTKTKELIPINKKFIEHCVVIKEI